ncbi:hypothetical protein ScPMuIL_016607, partial [Solemya velum]
RYGVWYKLPRTDSEAKNEGYIRQNDVCKTDKYHGFLYSKDGNTNTMPIYDLNGFIVGIQSAIPGNMKGYNSANKTISLPPHGVMPPIMLGETDSKGIQMYTVTAYFRHPGVICRPSARNISLGKGLFIQMAYNPEKEFEMIPLESRDLTPDWIMGNCMPKMGLHFFKNLSRNLPCEQLYPLFLMYDMEGKLGAFGWTFQGRPMMSHAAALSWFHLTPELYPFKFELSQLPPCMMNKDFQVFGINIWLRNPESLLCKREDQPKQVPETPAPVVKPSPTLAWFCLTNYRRKCFCGYFT